MAEHRTSTPKGRELDPSGVGHNAANGVHFTLIKFQVENLPYHIGLHNAITIPGNQLITMCTLIDEMYRFSVNNSIMLTRERHGTVFITSYRAATVM